MAPPSSQSCARPHPLGVGRTRAPDSHHTARPTLGRRAQRRRVGPRPRRGLCRFADLHRDLTRFVTTGPRATSMRGKYRLREMSGEKNDEFNMLEALAEHAPDVFRHELVAKHLDTTTTSLLWQVSKKLKSAVEATGVFTAGICELEGCEPEVIFKLSLSNKMYLNGSHVEPLEPGEQPSYCGTGTLFHQVNPELVTTVALAKWAKENGAPMNLRFAQQAVAVGNIDVVRWMVTDLWPRFPVLDQKMASVALANNRKDIFLELRAAGCPIDDGFGVLHSRSRRALRADEVAARRRRLPFAGCRFDAGARYTDHALPRGQPLHQRISSGASISSCARENERVDAPSRSLRKPHVRQVVCGGDELRHTVERAHPGVCAVGR